MILPSALLKSAVPYALALLVGGGFWVEHNAHEQELGALRERLQARELGILRLTRERDSVAAEFRVDTVTLAKWRTKYDSSGMRTALATIDSLHHLPQPPPDTVKIEVPIRVLVTADSAFRSCEHALGSCTSLQAAEHQRAELYRLQLGDVLKSEPGFVRRWSERAGIFGLGLLVGRAIR